MKPINHYKLTFLDKGNNELTTKTIAEYNIKKAKEYASKLKAESLINDLFKIKVTDVK